MRPHSEHGFVLITGLILLIALTLVAVTAMRNSGMELLMSENQIQRIEALENSEFPRQYFGELVDQHTLARGWPTDRGGDVAESTFRFTWPAGLRLNHDDGETPDDWYVRNLECVGVSPCALPSSGNLIIKAIYGDTDAQGESGRAVTSNLRVFKLRTDIAPGAGAAMVSGYEGLGRAAAAGGGQILYHIESESTSTRGGISGNGLAVTAATYRHVIRN